MSGRGKREPMGRSGVMSTFEKLNKTPASVVSAGSTKSRAADALGLAVILFICAVIFAYLAALVGLWWFYGTYGAGLLVAATVLFLLWLFVGNLW